MAEMDIWIRAFNGAMMVAQQNLSKLYPYVGEKRVGSRGSREYFDAFGTIEMSPKTGAPGFPTETPVAKSRRAVAPYDYEAATRIRKGDVQRELTDPRSMTVMTHAAAGARKMDALIYAALLGNATTVTSDGGTFTEASVALPTASIITDLTYNLTLDKLTEAGALMDEEYIPQDGRVFVFSARQRKALLNMQTFNDADYQTQKILASPNANVNGMPFAGFTLVQYEGCTLSSTTRKCVAFHPMFLCGVIGQDLQTKVTIEGLLGHDAWVYSDMSAGFGRRQEEAVIEVDCIDAA